MASIIMLSDMTLRQAENGYRTISLHGPDKPVKDNSSMTHFSPGMSNKLVTPVQLMSSFWEERCKMIRMSEESIATEGKDNYIGMCGIDGNVRTGRGEN